MQFLYTKRAFVFGKARNRLQQRFRVSRAHSKMVKFLNEEKLNLSLSKCLNYRWPLMYAEGLVLLTKSRYSQITKNNCPLNIYNPEFSLPLKSLSLIIKCALIGICISIISFSLELLIR